MNNLLQISKKINKAKRLSEAKLLATKNGQVSSYKRSVFEERIKQARKEMAAKEL